MPIRRPSSPRRSSPMATVSGAGRRRVAAVAAAVGRDLAGRDLLGRGLAGGVRHGQAHRDGYGVEMLEERRLLTTLTGSGSFLYSNSTSAAVQITYNDVSFEAIGDGTTLPTDIAVDAPVNLTPFDPAAPTPGSNLFKIYIADARDDSWISIAVLNLSPPTGPQLEPYANGGAVTYVSVNTNGAAPYSVNLPYGGVALGGPNTTLPDLNSFGLQPAPESGTLVGGVEMASVSPLTNLPNNFGNFLVGGTVFGQVYFGGNVNEFYAGAILTGDLSAGRDGLVPNRTPLPGANSQATTAPLAPVVPSTAAATSTTSATPASFANFSVTGDLRELLTLGPVGTDAAGSGTDPLYVTDFAATIGGALGEVHIGNATQLGGGSTNDEGSFAGTIQVGHNASVADGIAPTITEPNGTTEPDPLYDAGDFNQQSETEYLPNPGGPTYVGAEFGGGQATQDSSPFTGMAEAYLPDDATNVVVLASGAEVNLPADPQILGSIPILNGQTGLPVKDANGNVEYQASVIGNIEGTIPLVTGGSIVDQFDWYAMAFEAGQTFDVTMGGASGLSIFDPDGRLVATNAEAAASTTSPETLQVTADRPGLYYFEVSGATATEADPDYGLTVTNTGNLGFGGLHTDGFYDDDGFDSGLAVTNGDLGGIDVTGAGGTFGSLTLGPTPGIILANGFTTSSYAPVYSPTTVGVYAGSLRALTATNVGVASAADPLALVDGPFLNVPFGSVGLVQSVTGVLDLNTQFDLNTLDATLGETNNPEGPIITPTTNTAYATAVAGPIQVIDAAGLGQFLIADDKGIGTIRAGSMGTDVPSYIDVNADNAGADGIIDLVDVSGAVGTPSAGGPVFITNDGGQVRYFQVPAGETIYRDAQFGLEDDYLTGAPGQVMSFVDQAGNKVQVAPQGLFTYQSSSGTGATTVTSGPAITMLLYPVHDKSGFIPISVSSTQSLSIAAAGTAANNAEVDVGRLTINTAGAVGYPIQVTGATDKDGNSVIAQQTSSGTLNTTTSGTVSTGGTRTRITTGTTDANDLYALFTGPATVNVLQVTADGSTTLDTGNVSEIENDTRGEIVNVSAAAVGTIQTVGNLGYATSEATPAAVLPRAIISNGDTFPFDQQHTGVLIGTDFGAPGIVVGTSLISPVADGIGDAVQILVGGAVANVQVGGTLQTLVANAGSAAPPGQLDGITGPVLATNILNVNIGQGIPFAGTGAGDNSGIYALNSIGSVSNAGNSGADIRGPILDGDIDGAQHPVIGIVQLTNGSIIDTHIESLDNAFFFQASDLYTMGVVLSGTVEQPFDTNYVYDIGAVIVSGSGGIIGGDISAQNIGPVVVSGGFGILDSDVTAAALGRVNEVIASGYGIRGTSIGGGGYIGPVTASGNGSLVPTSAYPLSVRPSDIGAKAIDPNTGMYPLPTTDLNGALGVTGSSGVESDVTDTGVIEDDTIDCLDDFAGLTANRVRTATPEVSTAVSGTTSAANVPVYGVQFANSISVGGTLGLIRVYNITDGLQVVAGHLGKVLLSNNASRLGIAVAGPIDNFVVHGNIGTTITDPQTGNLIEDSYIRANGEAGTISKLQVYGSLFANVTATGRIGTMTVYGDIQGALDASGNVTGTKPGLPTFYAINTLRVSGGIKNGALTIGGPINNLIIGNGLGVTTGSLDIAGGVNNITVGADHHPGALLALNLSVAGSLNKLTVYGRITGNVSIGGNLQALSVTDDAPGTNAVTGAISVGGHLNGATITNGNLAGDLTVNGDLYGLTVNRGSIAANAVVSSTLASIHNLRVVGGATDGIAGSVEAPSGTGLNVFTTGSFGDGTDAATISALSAGSISIGGNVANAARVAIVATVNSVTVGGSLQAGGTIIGHPIKRHAIRGTTLGTLTTA